MNYSERLNELGLTTLELRRQRGDLLQIFKIFKKIDETSINIRSLNEKKYQTRSHKYQIERDPFDNCPFRNSFLLNRSATIWNALPYDIVNAVTVNSFKARLDEYVKSNHRRGSIYIN